VSIFITVLLVEVGEKDRYGVSVDSNKKEGEAVTCNNSKLQRGRGAHHKVVGLEARYGLHHT
jgi:hypothetical protein